MSFTRLHLPTMSSPLTNGHANGDAHKRPREEETDAVRTQVLAQASAVMARDVSDAAGSSTLLDLGITSVAAASLKNWMFRSLEAELSTYDLTHTPLAELYALVVAAQKVALGAVVPPAPDGVPPPPAEEPERIDIEPTAPRDCGPTESAVSRRPV